MHTVQKYTTQWPHSIYTHIVGTRVLGDTRPRTSYSLVPRPARTPSAVGCHCPGPRSPIGHRSRQLGARYNYNAARPLPAPAPARTHDTRRPPHASASAHTAHIPLPPASSTHLLGDGTAGLLYSSVRRFTPLTPPAALRVSAYLLTPYLLKPLTPHGGASRASLAHSGPPATGLHVYINHANMKK